jgi:hypothetical protein
MAIIKRYFVDAIMLGREAQLNFLCEALTAAAVQLLNNHHESFILGVISLV